MRVWRAAQGEPVFSPALAALVLGWFLMLAIVLGATAVLLLILHAVM